MQSKVQAALEAAPNTTHTTSLQKWSKLLGMLRSITPSLAVSCGVFTRVQHALMKAARRHVKLTACVHNKIKAWRELVRSLASRTTHFFELQLFPQTWMGMTDASCSGKEGFCQYPEGQ